MLKKKPVIEERCFIIDQNCSSASSKPPYIQSTLQPLHKAPAFLQRGRIFLVKEKLVIKYMLLFSIYKGKAALSLSPILPTFTKSESGNVVVERRGSVMLKFMPAIDERKYDSEKKQLFALSATEVGSLIILGPKDSCELFHDPSMQSSNAGQVRKSLSIKPHADGYFFSLTVVNNLLKTRESFSVPVTTAEFAVMKAACSFALPHIIGWDQLTNKTSKGVEVQKSEMVEPQLLDEWER